MGRHVSAGTHFSRLRPYEQKDHEQKFAFAERMLISLCYDGADGWAPFRSDAWRFHAIAANAEHAR